MEINNTAEQYENPFYHEITPTISQSSSIYPNSPQKLLLNGNANSAPANLESTETLSRKRSITSSKSFDLKLFNERVTKWRNRLTSKFPHWYVNSSKYIEGITNEIHYSVFIPSMKYKPLDKLPKDGFVDTGPINKQLFESIVEDSINAMTNLQIIPQRISAGSSGSYFIFNSNGKIVGVFKPKDEEPYGPLSPKWTKWIHRNLFPFFFGRSCLIPNLGYICEAAASLLDRQLQTHIVPYTETVSLSSPSFYYQYFIRKKYNQNNLPKKVGSFQIFLNGYMEADKFFKKYPFPSKNKKFPVLDYLDDNNNKDQIYFEWTPQVIQQFREELEKLVILDYIMRNTDRGLDNWMIKLEYEKINNEEIRFDLKIGAIDSGLSWPWKHPDEWRSFPFGWLFLPLSIIGHPFSENTKRHFLPILTSITWWEESKVLFHQLFARDSDFKERMWKKQWAIMKGQAFNVVESLKTLNEGPLELARRTRIIVWDKEIEIPVQVPISSLTTAIETPLISKRSFNPHSLVKKALEKRNVGDMKTIIENENNEEEIEIDSEIIPKINIDPFNDNFEVQSNELNALQSSWTELLKGNISDKKFDSTKQQFDNNSNNNNNNHNSDLEIPNENITNRIITNDRVHKNVATRRVIVEKLEAVTSKPPVFTWC